MHMKTFWLVALIAGLAAVLEAAGGLGVSPVALTRETMAGVAASSDTLRLTNTSAAGTVYYGASVTAGGGWLGIAGTVQGALGPGGAVGLTVSYAALGAGEYSGQILVTNALVEGGVTNAGSPREVPVLLRVNPRPELMVSATVISNMASEGEDAEPRIFQVWNGSGYYTLTYSIADDVPWVIPSVSGGTSTSEHDVISLDYSTAGLAAGSYTGRVTVTASEPVGGTNARVIVLRLEVTGLAGLGCDGVAQEYNLRMGDSPVARSFKVWNTGVSAGTALRWSAAVVAGGGNAAAVDQAGFSRQQADTSWLTLAPAGGELGAGAAPRTVTLTCNPAGLAPGNYSAIVRVSGVDTLTGLEARGSPYDIGVGLLVRAGDRLHFGGDYGSALLVYGAETGLWGLGDLSGATVWDLFGGYGYYPVPGDYNGDGTAELGVYRAASGGWYWKGVGSGDVVMLGNWGGADYRPVQGDFDGDGRQDFILYNEAAGRWYALLSGYGYQGVMVEFGGPGYAAVHGDFDGDGRADPALYNAGAGTWHGLLSSLGYKYIQGQFGGAEYAGLAGDFDGDGRSELCLYHASGRWYILAVDGRMLVHGDWWGGPGWAPVTADYDGDGADDLAVYEAASGRWRIRRLNGTILAWDMLLGGYGYQAVGK